MAAVKLQYLVDDAGAKIGVILPIERYKEMLEELEELEDIRAYDEAKSQQEESIPFEQAIAEIESQRNDL